MTNYSPAYRALQVLKDMYKVRDLLTKISTELSDLGQEAQAESVDDMIMALADQRDILSKTQASWEENDK
jgi:hypothetical protein